ARFDEWMRGLCEDPEQYTPIADAPSDGVKHTLVLARPARRVLERDIRRQLTGSRETFVYFVGPAKFISRRRREAPDVQE
ncbi:MAG: hypothetical protein ACLGIW_19290, partial [Gammaproteobacteria bacterium]